MRAEGGGSGWRRKEKIETSSSSSFLLLSLAATEEARQGPSVFKFKDTKKRASKYISFVLIPKSCYNRLHTSM